MISGFEKEIDAIVKHERGLLIERYDGYLEFYNQYDHLIKCIFDEKLTEKMKEYDPNIYVYQKHSKQGTKVKRTFRLSLPYLDEEIAIIQISCRFEEDELIIERLAFSEDRSPYTLNAIDDEDLLEKANFMVEKAVEHFTNINQYRLKFLMDKMKIWIV